MKGIHYWCLLIPPPLLLHHCGPLSMTKWVPQAWLCKPLIPPLGKGCLSSLAIQFGFTQLLVLFLFIEANTWHVCIKNGLDSSFRCMLVSRKRVSHTDCFQLFFRNILGFLPWCFHMSSYPNCIFFIMFEKQMTSNITSKLNFLEKAFNK